MRQRAASGICLVAGACLFACKTTSISSVSPPEAGSVSSVASAANERSKLDPEIDGVISLISEARLSSAVKTLVAFGTRNSCADPLGPRRGVAAARDFLKRELSEITGVKVTLDPFLNPKCIPPVTSNNVIGYLPGDA